MLMEYLLDFKNISELFDENSLVPSRFALELHCEVKFT